MCRNGTRGGYIEINFATSTTEPNLNLYGRHIDDNIEATRSTNKELNQCIASVNSFHPALKHFCEISETLVAFLDIKGSITSNSASPPVCTTNVLTQLFAIFIFSPVPREKFMRAVFSANKTNLFFSPRYHAPTIA